MIEFPVVIPESVTKPTMPQSRGGAGRADREFVRGLLKEEATARRN